MKKGLFQKLLPHIIAVAVFLVVALIFCQPALEGKVLNQEDIVGAKAMARNAWEYREQYGHLPLWNTNVFSGMPNYQIAIEGPNLLANFSAIFSLGLPKPINFFFISCICFYILCMAFRTNPYVGIFGALAYAYITYNPVIISAGHDTKMMAISFAPGLLAGLVWLYEKRYWIGAAITALFATMEITANHPQINYYLMIVIGFMTISYLIIWIRNKEWKHTGIALSLALLGALIGIGNAAIPLLPTYEYTKYTMRGGKTIETTPTGVVNKKTTGLDESYAFQYSLGKSEAVTLLMPNAFGGSSAETYDEESPLVEELVENNIPEGSAIQVASQLPRYWGGIVEGTSGTVYFGVISCLLFIVGLVLFKSHHRWWILAAAVLGIFMAWGKYFPGFNNFIFDTLPLYNKFRAPSMALVIPQFVVPILATLTLQHILFTDRTAEETRKYTKYFLYSIGGTLLFLSLLYLINDYKSPIDKEIMSAYSAQQGGAEIGRMIVDGMIAARKSMFGGDVLRVLWFALFLTGVLYLWRRKIISPLVVIIGLTLVNTLDLVSVGKRYLNEDRYIEAEAYTEANFNPTPVDLEILKDKDPHYRVYNLTPDRFLMSATTANISYHHRAVGGYHPAKLRIYQDLIEGQLSKTPMNMAVMNMLDTRYFLIPDQQGRTITSFQRNDSALGAAWFIKQLEPVNGPAEEMKALDAFNPAETAFFDRSTQNIQATQFTPDASATIRLTKYNNDTAEYTTTAAQPQFAVFSEIYYPAGWNAYVDGKKTAHFKVNYLLRGLPVPAGQHKITFILEPASYKTGYTLALWSGILLYLLLIGAAVYLFLKNRRKEPVKAEAEKKA